MAKRKKSMITEVKEKQKTVIHSEQWRVVTDGYKDTYDSKEPANRVYGQISSQIKKDGEGQVILQYRSESVDGKASEWVDIKEFLLEDDEDDDEDDE
jgi:hypothetical protein